MRVCSDRNRFSLARRRMGLLSVLVLAGIVCAGAADDSLQRPFRLAVLPLEAPAEHPWLGQAVAETLIMKLSGLDRLVLVERARIDEVLAATPRDSIAPSLLGADGLVTGSVQLDGDWDDPDARIRVTLHVVQAETGATNPAGAMVQDGRVRNLFAMETALARAAADRLQLESNHAALARRCVRSRDGLRTLGIGRQALLDARRSASEEEARRHLQIAIRNLRQAQAEYGGGFFARAHQLEAEARERLACRQPGDGKRRTVRAQTVQIFRNDAAEAAPAFYDFGRALEAAESFEQAADAYAQYARWMSEQARVLRWERRNAYATRVGVPAHFGTNMTLVSRWEYLTATPRYLILGGAPKVRVFDRATRELLWTGSMKGESHSLKCLNRFMNGNDHSLAVLNGDRLRLYDTPTGEVRFDLQLDPPLASGPIRKHVRHYGAGSLKDHQRIYGSRLRSDTIARNSQDVRNMVYLFPASGPAAYVGVCRMAYRDDLSAMRTTIDAVLTVVDATTGRVAWRRSWRREDAYLGAPRYGGPVSGTRERIDPYWRLPQAWNGAFLVRFPAGEDASYAYLDAATGDDASDRLSPEIPALLASDLKQPRADEFRDGFNPYCSYGAGFDLLRDGSGEGRYFVALERWKTTAPPERPEEATAYHAPPPDAAPTPTHPPRTVAPRAWQWLNGNSLVVCLPRGSSPFSPMTGRATRTQRAALHDALRLPRLEELRNPERHAVREAGGWLDGTTYWRRDGQNSVRRYRLSEGAPSLLHVHRHPIEIYSTPVYDDESIFLIVTKTGRDGLHLNEIGFSGIDRTMPTEAAAYMRQGLCLEAMGEREAALTAMERAAHADANLIEAHTELIRLYRETGRPGKCSIVCEDLLGRFGFEHPQAKAWESAYREALGVVEHLPEIHDYRCSNIVGDWLLYWCPAGHLHYFNLKTGESPWCTPEASSLGVRGDVICVFCSNSGLKSIDPSRGKVISALRREDEGVHAWFDTFRGEAQLTYAPLQVVNEVSFGPGDWAATVPVYIVEQAEEDGPLALVALEPKTLERRWTQPDLPCSSPARIWVEHTLDAVVLACSEPTDDGGGRLHLKVFRHEDGERLLSTATKVDAHRQDAQPILQVMGGVARTMLLNNGGGREVYSFDIRPPVPDRPAATPCGQLALWLLHPEGPQVVLDRNRWVSEKEIIARSTDVRAFGGVLWKGGPMLICRSGTLRIDIVDPRTGETLAGGPVGLKEDSCGYTTDTRIQGDYVIGNSEVMNRAFVFRKDRFLSVLGWTPEREAAYRAKTDRPAGE